MQKIKKIAKKLFLKAGASEQEAEIVSEEIIEASLMGLDSHGVMRIAQYLEQVKEGLIKPNTAIDVIYETPISAIVDCNWNFGMVCARMMTDIVIEKANKNNIAVAASRHCNHMGRLGSYTQRIAQAGLFGFAVVNSSRHGHFVAPFGGAEGRLATNLSYAVPTYGDPILLDTSTSMVSEGKIRVLMHQGKELPENCILTSEGRPTNIPEEFYKPKKGTILPFGGEMGYKGFGLGLLVEILGSTLSGVALTPDGEKDKYINGFFVMAINPKIFGIENEIIKNMEALKKYIKSAKPAQGLKGIFMPGELDFTTRAERLTGGIEVADETWKQIVDAAKLFNVVL
ncbi:MAG: Ldh family oxidoreductase [Candidatus Humimicrobiaceae bacterium]